MHQWPILLSDVKAKKNESFDFFVVNGSSSCWGSINQGMITGLSTRTLAIGKSEIKSEHRPMIPLDADTKRCELDETGALWSDGVGINDILPLPDTILRVKLLYLLQYESRSLLQASRHDFTDIRGIRPFNRYT